MTTQTYTDQQLSDWKRYEKVRKGGKWNMFFPQARVATGLSNERYSFVMEHFSELKEAVEAKSANRRSSATRGENRMNKTTKPSQKKRAKPNPKGSLKRMVSRLDALLAAGQACSNVCYNLSQPNKTLADADRECLRRAYQAWDSVLRHDGAANDKVRRGEDAADTNKKTLPPSPAPHG